MTTRSSPSPGLQAPEQPSLAERGALVGTQMLASLELQVPEQPSLAGRGSDGHLRELPVPSFRCPSNLRWLSARLVFSRFRTAVPSFRCPSNLRWPTNSLDARRIGNALVPSFRCPSNLRWLILENGAAPSTWLQSRALGARATFAGRSRGSAQDGSPGPEL